LECRRIARIDAHPSGEITGRECRGGAQERRHQNPGDLPTGGGAPGNGWICDQCDCRHEDGLSSLVTGVDLLCGAVRCRRGRGRALPMGRVMLDLK
jgi:hypothetical protein